jgi:hypothetical protein
MSTQAGTIARKRREEGMGDPAGVGTVFGPGIM